MIKTAAEKKMIKNRMIRYTPLYVIAILPLAWYFIFCYLPMYGIIIAWKDYNPFQGIWGSPWVGWRWFKMILSSILVWRITFNTIWVYILKLVFGFPAPIIFALLLNEVRHIFFKRTIQTVSYLPHFLSWILIYGIWWAMSNPMYGSIPNLLSHLSIHFTDPSKHQSTFIGFLVISSIWKGIGWGSIIYLAAITCIDPQLYESAIIDGASRLKQIYYITLPSIANLVVLMFIFAIGGLLSGDFEQIYIFAGIDTALLKVSENFDVYLFNNLVSANYSYPAAVGLFRNVVSVLLIIVANKIAKRYQYEGIW